LASRTTAASTWKLKEPFLVLLDEGKVDRLATRRAMPDDGLVEHLS